MIRKIFSFIMLTFLVACGTSTKIIGSWKANPDKVYHFNNIAVIVIANKADVRKTAEAAIESKLIASGIKATGALWVFPPNATKENMTKELVIAWLNSYGFDAVLTVSLLKTETEVTSSAGVGVGVAGYPAYPGYGMNFNDYYGTMYGYAYMPVYTSTSKNVYLQTNLFTFPEQNSIWIAQTESLDVTNVEVTAGQLGEAIVAELLKQNVIAP